ncbi:MAG TPA: glutaredoxin family protein [Candidatus Limnocylindrales bacterium]|nr:glutaredoxin family protein [Candidatus Limnocylindrales bacterium]
MAATPLLPDLVLYTRPGCHLCDDARVAIQSILEDRAARSQPLARLTERDITADPDLERALGTTIPVVELRGERLELAVSPVRLRRFLERNLDAVRA